MNQQKSSVWLLLASLGLTLIVSYVLMLFLLFEKVGLFTYFFIVLVLAVSVFALLYACANRNWISLSGIQGIAITTLITVAGIFFIDKFFTAHISSDAGKSNLVKFGAGREIDQNYVPGELYPRLYFPTEKNFRLHKPNVSVSGSHYGLFYHQGMLKSPTLTQNVLQKSTLSININQYGFRETKEFSDARLFALGDSFAFGWGVPDGDIWVDLVEKQVGQPVYNLGLHDSSPKQEIELLKHVLENYGDQIEIDHLFWMIYEGNDLEGSYLEINEHYHKPKKPKKSFFEKVSTKLEKRFSKFKRNTVVQHFRQGRAELIASESNAEQEGFNRHEVDGVTFRTPLYKSEKLGYRLFIQHHIDRAMEPLSYVLEHENRPLMDNVFSEMSHLAKENGFTVTVMVAPTAARLHGPSFEGFPQLSSEPHYINYVHKISIENGFQVLDLNNKFQEYASEELLYFRDDDHWNVRGNEIVGDLIAKHFLENNGFQQQLPQQ